MNLWWLCVVFTCIQQYVDTAICCLFFLNAPLFDEKEKSFFAEVRLLFIPFNSIFAS